MLEEINNHLYYSLSFSGLLLDATINCQMSGSESLNITDHIWVGTKQLRLLDTFRFSFFKNFAFLIFFLVFIGFYFFLTLFYCFSYDFSFYHSFCYLFGVQVYCFLNIYGYLKALAKIKMNMMLVDYSAFHFYIDL